MIKPGYTFKNNFRNNLKLQIKKFKNIEGQQKLGILIKKSMHPIRTEINRSRSLTVFSKSIIINHTTRRTMVFFSKTGI